MNLPVGNDDGGGGGGEPPGGGGGGGGWNPVGGPGGGGGRLPLVGGGGGGVGCHPGGGGKLLIPLLFFLFQVFCGFRSWTEEQFHRAARTDMCHSRAIPSM